jgi:cyclopropane-fatty-acyl-phospholipid synthase
VTAVASDPAVPPSRPPLAAVDPARVDVSPLLARSEHIGRVPEMGARAVRASLPTLLRALEGGTLELREGHRRSRHRSRRPDRYGRPDVHATVEVLDPRAYTALLHGSSGLGEAYRRGWFDTDDLTALLRLLARTMRVVEPVRSKLHRATRPIAGPWRRRRRPDDDRDRADIAAHYDLGNDFFAAFLDPTMTYSAGIFERPDATMAEASRAKLDRICRSLDLRPGQRVVEVGTGWGSFALHAASEYGVHVVTTTLSAEQHAIATERVAAAGLSAQVEVRLDHYRDLTGTFDALVAVEMIEAVDWRELDDFLGVCGRLLSPEGAAVFQAIVAPPDRHERALASTDFIKTHVFPGGNLPSVPSILQAAGRTTDLMPVEVHDFGADYAETLRRWRSALATNNDEIGGLGLDDEFLRLWDFYLCYCEAGFSERLVSVVQMVLARPGWSPT